MNQQNQLSQVRGFGKLLWNPDTLQHHSFRHLTSAQFQAPLSKARGLAEILKKNYIIITLATLRRASRLRFCVLASHNRRPLCPSERDPYHTDHCKDQHKGRGERYFITRVLARSVSFVGFCQPPFYAAGKKNNSFNRWRASLAVTPLDQDECTLKLTQTYVRQHPV